MRGVRRRFVSLAVLALLTSCEKPGTNPGGAPDSSKPELGAAREIVTQSGVEMIALPGGEFFMDSAAFVRRAGDVHPRFFGTMVQNPPEGFINFNVQEWRRARARQSFQPFLCNVFTKK